MEVSLLYHTPNPERAIATAARLCYSDVSASQLLEEMSDEQVERLISIVTENGHSSTLEHASYTFGVEGISRACSHQLVRHRLASYNQQSQRYVKWEDDQEMNFVEPESISESIARAGYFHSALNECRRAYAKLLELGVPAEDARFILPNAAATNIVITMNARELQHFFSVRCCNRAQWEIRDLAWKMLELVKPTAPHVFKLSGPSCLRRACPEGKMSCGNPYKLKEI